jgi:hypothetical protein
MLASRYVSTKRTCAVLLLEAASVYLSLQLPYVFSFFKPSLQSNMLGANALINVMFSRLGFLALNSILCTGQRCHRKHELVSCSNAVLEGQVRVQFLAAYHWHPTRSRRPPHRPLRGPPSSHVFRFLLEICLRLDFFLKMVRMHQHTNRFSAHQVKVTARSQETLSYAWVKPTRGQRFRPEFQTW